MSQPEGKGVAYACVQEGQRLPMREVNLEPAPRSWVEKVYDLGSLHVLPAAVILLFAFPPLSAIVGHWPALAILIPATIALTALVSSPIISMQRRRVARDAEQGLFQCALRKSGSTLKGKWAAGYAKIEPGRFLFQTTIPATGSGLIASSRAAPGWPAGKAQVVNLSAE
ncbi:hypothetical protein [Pseudarthrobacter sp. NS4]|uniref:hypothetical protein n=1 Tax=Pseudarthrobacter sp. NS4 TaxID=2973976 RepID=UPI002161C9EC|nr:hypothetical protein [Pseudarthrobacter sp. NS4]